MKRILAFLLLLCCLPLAACGEDKTKKYTESEELQVLSAFTYDCYAVVIVKNVSQEDVLDFVLAYVEYGDDGHVVTSDSRGCTVGKVENANIKPGEEYIATFATQGGKMVDAVVYGLTHSDGTHWALDKLKNWITYSKANYTAAVYKENILSFTGKAAAAEQMEYLDITPQRLKKDGSDMDVLDVTAFNKTVYAISDIKMVVLQFDDNGLPIKVTHDTYWKNACYAGGSVKLASGKELTFTSGQFFEPECVYYKLIVSSFKYTDENGQAKDWLNPYLYEWVLYNNESYIEGYSD